MVLHEEVEHHLAQLVLHLGGEVVKETEKILKTYKFREILGCSHNLHKEILQLAEQFIIRGGRKCEILKLAENLFDEQIHTGLVEVFNGEFNENDGTVHVQFWFGGFVHALPAKVDEVQLGLLLLGWRTEEGHA